MATKHKIVAYNDVSESSFLTSLSASPGYIGDYSVGIVDQNFGYQSMGIFDGINHSPYGIFDVNGGLFTSGVMDGLGNGYTGGILSINGSVYSIGILTFDGLVEPTGILEADNDYYSLTDPSSEPYQTGYNTAPQIDILGTGLL